MNSAFVVTQRVAQDYNGPWTSGYLQLGPITAVFCPKCRHQNPVAEEPPVYTLSGRLWRCEVCGHEWQFPEMKAWHVVEGETV